MAIPTVARPRELEPEEPDPPRPRVLTGGRVYTMVGEEPVEAVAYAGGRLLAAGAAAEVAARAGPDAEVVDLAGRTVVPGFIDAHHHLSAAVLYAGAVDCSPGAAGSVAALVGRLRSAAASLPAGEWVVGFGYDDLGYPERRAPRREDLDAACPDHPAVVLHFSFHQCVANTRALEAAGIGRTTPDPPAGKIGRGARGEPDGRLYETAIATVETAARRNLAARDGDGFAARFDRYQHALFAVGVTRLADPTVPRETEALYRSLLAAGRLKLSVVMMPVSDRGYLLPALDRLDESPTGEGTGRLRVGPLKLFFDGGDNCAVCLTVWQLARASLRVAAKMVRARSVASLRMLRRSSARLGADLHVHSGVMYFRRDADAAALASRAVERGWALAIHALGNEAVAQAVRVLARVRRRHGDHPPPRIEHAMLVDDPVVRRMGDLEIGATVQPGFLDIPGTDLLPAPAGIKLFGFRSLRDAGVRLAGSSDAPVVGFDPLAAMRTAVTRRAAAGHRLGPDEALTPRDVLGMYTVEAARACGVLDVSGTLEPGKAADLVILSGDPLAPGGLEGLRVLETVAAGETVFRAERPG